MGMPLAVAGAGSMYFVMQSYLGTSDDFFAGSFITKKDPEDIAEFYQAEDLLKIIAMHPFFFSLFMGKVDFDAESPTEDKSLLGGSSETHMRVKLLGMEVSFEIIETEEEQEDGEMMVTKFLRHERFIDWVPLLADVGVKIPLWDQTWKYGFDRRDDGTVEVYHHGESFKGPWFIRIIVFFHQRYVLWACERFINGDSFGTDDLDRQQEQLACIPLSVFHDFVGKLKAEQEKDLEAERKSPVRDEKVIAQRESAIKKLETLGKSQESTISMAKRDVLSSFAGSDAQSVKLVVGNAHTQDALADAMKDAKGNRNVNAAMQELMGTPGLKWEGRATQSRIASRQSRRISTKASTKPKAAAEAPKAAAEADPQGKA